jgi:hypothetical protein
VEAWIKSAKQALSDFIFPNQIQGSPHISKRHYARVVHRRIASIGLDEARIRKGAKGYSYSDHR